MRDMNFRNFTQAARPVTASEAGVMASVYRWMATGLAITGVVAFLTARSPLLLNLIFGIPLMPFVLFACELGLVMYIGARIEHLAPETAGSLFYIYSAVNGLTMSVIFLAYTGASIASTFIVAAGMFGGMSVYGYTTKKDLTEWGSFFFMGLIGLILASVVNIFLRSPAVAFAVSYLGVFIFIGLTAYDTQKIKYILYGSSSSESTVNKYVILGALTLYLDFINLFLFLLRIMGNRRD